jgi:hypothetical protein
MNIGYKEGFYIFGGEDERCVLQNDLWLATPQYEYNKHLIEKVNYEFIGKSKLSLKLKQINDFSGTPPCPRT